MLCYIKYGWDQYLVDPDRGVNCQRKLMSTLPPQSLSYELLRSLPDYDDSQWTSQLHKLPKVTFSTIYCHLVDRKVHLKKVSYLEDIADRSPGNSNDEALQPCADQLNTLERLVKLMYFSRMIMYRTLNTILFQIGLVMSASGLLCYHPCTKTAWLHEWPVRIVLVQQGCLDAATMWQQHCTA